MRGGSKDPIKFSNKDHPPNPWNDISGSPVPLDGTPSEKLAGGCSEASGMGSERSADRYFCSVPRGLKP